ncbi:MAG TPA: hypothetical protein PKA57_12105 [Parvibaculum sp.]|uniref:Kelch repeat-containing protein n=1 Tax=Parvibaculum sp. TaxID=2024848 RepID=UPI002C1073E7|nr:kelch repeat-containing protein [Parvibaculum sp.]HMM15361.1 hypothetical protein [Parvibaculum sp.]
MSEPDSRSRLLAMIGAVLIAAATALLPGGAAAEGWRDGTPMTTARAYAGAALLGDDLYVIGGGGISGPRSMTEIYDTVGDIWRAAAALPVGLQQFGIAVSGGKIYVAGGYSARGTRDERIEEESDNLWIFDPAVGTWISGAPMPSSRVALGLAAAGGKLYAIGGKGPDAGRVFVYSPETERWAVAAASMPAPRSDLALAVIGDEIYVIGGHEGKAATPRVDIFDTARQTWRPGPALPSPREGHVAAVLDGRIHVTGGESLSPPRSYADHFVLDAKGGAWGRAAPLPTPRHAAVAAVAHGRLFVIGGSPGAGVYTVFTQSDVVDIYSPDK